MDERDYRELQFLIEDEFGLSLKAHTRESLVRKLEPILNNLKMGSVREYLDFLHNDPRSRLELSCLPGYIMNTESYFLREFPQFELFLQLCSQTTIKDSPPAPKALRILSAGCSEGQEPYSISMLVRNNPGLFRGLDISISGIDINVAAIERARRGYYSSYAFRSPESAQIMKYFEKNSGRKSLLPGRNYSLRPEITGSVDYLKGNVLRPLVLKGLRDFDFIFCRNLLMYMSDRAAEKILFNLWEAMTDSAYLFIGQSETLKGNTGLFEPVKFRGVTVYRKRPFSDSYR